jgi:hypothetical protein
LDTSQAILDKYLSSMDQNTETDLQLIKSEKDKRVYKTVIELMRAHNIPTERRFLLSLGANEHLLYKVKNGIQSFTDKFIDLLAKSYPEICRIGGDGTSCPEFGAT